MKVYSLDLRERVAAACAQSGRIVGAVAAQFSVSVSFVAKLLRHQRQSGSLAALSHRSGPAPSLDASARTDLAGLPAPAARCHLGRVAGVGGRAGRPGREPGHDGAGRAGSGLAAKKKSVHAAERDTARVKALRVAFLEAVPSEDFACFKFVDEPGTTLTYCRRYARAEGRQRAHARRA